MDDFVGAIIIFVIFILGPLIENMRKKQQRPPPPPQPRPRVDYDPEKTKRIEVPGAPTAEQPGTQVRSAEDMVPSELWEILTGQQRPQPTPVPRAPAPDVEDEEIGYEEAIVLEDVSAETRRSRFEEAVSLETMPVRYEPNVVSLETTPDPKKRHLAFHQKVDQPPLEALAARRIRPLHFTTAADLRRAIVIQTILGPPKALE
jgi:hypothetical protein